MAAASVNQQYCNATDARVVHVDRLWRSGGTYSAADELITTPPRQPPPPALRLQVAAVLSPPSGEQPGAAGRAPRGGICRGAEGGARGEGAVQMGFNSNWDPSAVLVC